MNQTVSKDAEDAWMTAEQAAEYLQVAEGTIKQWVKLKRIPFGRVGSQARFKRADLDEWARARGERAA